jgi:hypothetical protein
MVQIDSLLMVDDEQLMMDYVICGEADLLLLDVVLRETLTTNA